MAIETPSLQERQTRFEFIKEQRTKTPPASYEKIAQALTAQTGRPISRQAVHKIWSTGEVRPTGRPRKTTKQEQLQGEIAKLSAKRATMLNSPNPNAVKIAILHDRIATLIDELEALVA